MARNQKYLNENLAPLKRWLRRRVGRPWSAIYRDISVELTATSAVKQPGRDHLADCVELPARIGPQGQVLRPPHRGSWVFGRLSVGDLYVDPRTGILRIVRPWQRKRR